MSKPNPGENSSLLESVKQLDAQLEDAAKNFDATIEQARQAGASGAEGSPDLQGLEQGQDAATEMQPVAQVEQHESVVEKAFDEYKKVDEDHPDESPYVIKKAATQRDDTTQQLATKTPQQIKIEEILAEGLTELFHGMSPEDQIAFKQAGEETAKEIATLADQFKLTARRALKLITKWLRMIPGVNVFFLEQEAKIKTEEIMRYSKKQYNENR